MSVGTAGLQMSRGRTNSSASSLNLMKVYICVSLRSTWDEVQKRKRGALIDKPRDDAHFAECGERVGLAVERLLEEIHAR